MNIGILGTGSIAEKMSATINKMNNAHLYAVASRTAEKAKSFSERYHIENYYATYEELVKDKNIDLVYIATPHSRHYEDCMMCLENGKNVLCEKAFTANAKQAEKVFEYAKSHNVFVSEAIWTRFMPMRFVLDDIIKTGVIGEISSLTANIGYNLLNKERVQKPELAGGALLDIGIYTINFALMTFGNDIAEIKSTCIKNKYGVDIIDNILITFNDNKTALLHNNTTANTDKLGVIYGTNGRIEFNNINNCESIKVILNNGEIQNYETPPQISGYEYEVEASLNAIKAGKIETDFMPHCETLRVMKIMDSLRNEWGIKYPFE
ncbi:MAG: Gfo/Idh/MocA family oxidoreductase [Ruminococcus sp.]|nr:Gfo/Idh/MocA family oxidoreductase [Ruminococcus sp.]